MHTLINKNDFEDLDEFDLDLPIRGSTKTAEIRKKPAAPKGFIGSAILLEERQESYSYTYKASRFEAGWLNASLDLFYEERWFDDVLRQIKGGKEASVYLCRGNTTSGSPFVAVKVYRPRMYRNLKDDYLYRDGRERLDASGNIIRNSGMNHAMNKRTDFGLQLLHQDWIQHEYETMRQFHNAGGHLPRPLTSSSNAVLMEYIGDEGGAAPILSSVRLGKTQAKRCWLEVCAEIDLLLSLGIVHGDLSAFNFLYWADRAWMIDFPQAVPALANRNAWQFFQRDMVRLCGYFNRQGLNLDGEAAAKEIWTGRGLAIPRPPKSDV